jgi:hypothetical protein
MQKMLSEAANLRIDNTTTKTKQKDKKRQKEKQ